LAFAFARFISYSPHMTDGFTLTTATATTIVTKAKTDFL